VRRAFNIAKKKKSSIKNKTGHNRSEQEEQEEEKGENMKHEKVESEESDEDIKK
jgi:hypothetical protein